MNKTVTFKIKGMQRDLSVSSFSPEYAYENKNIRITPTDDNTMFSIVNEKGNKVTDINNIGDSLKGVPIGQALMDNELIVFTSGDEDSKTAKNINLTTDNTEDINSEVITIDDIDSATEDRIYKLWFNNSTLSGTVLYKGNLNFNYKHPIESLVSYENQELKKVYWVDGLNQPRVINIAASLTETNKWNDYSFDFVRKLKLQETVEIERNLVANGDFDPGVIQYAFTYFDKYGQESNIFYTSPLYYISYNNRGASSEDRVGNSFSIVIGNVDKNFDYVRIYSIHRTSIDATPTVRRVVDLAVPKVTTYSMTEWKKYATADDIKVMSDGTEVPLSSITPDSTSSSSSSWNLAGFDYPIITFPDRDHIYVGMRKTVNVTVSNGSDVSIHYTDGTEMTVNLYTKVKVSYTDNGISGDTIDPTELLYVGGEEVILGTLNQKDNTLFLGDVILKRKLIDSDIKKYFKNRYLEFDSFLVDSNTKYLISPDPIGYYPYDNQLKLGSARIKTFKYLETYRLGVQFQHYTGKWSEPIWVNDVRNMVHINASYIAQDKIYLPSAKLTVTNRDIIRKLTNQGYVRVRPIIVYPSLEDRECICQGILCPTVYNVVDRKSNAPFAQSSWFTRANAPFDYDKSLKGGLYVPPGESSSGAGFSLGEWSDRESSNNSISINSRAGAMSNTYKDSPIDYKIYDGYKSPVYYEARRKDLIYNGAWAEFRHNYPIPDNDKRNAEIQCISETTTPYCTSSSSEGIKDEFFYIDQSIVTFHSPDIEFDSDIRSIDTSNLKLRIVGYVPLTSFIGDIDIQTSTPPLTYNIFNPDGSWAKVATGDGFRKQVVSSSNISRHGWKSLISGLFWKDGVLNGNGDKHSGQELYVVYPFHRNGSLNNTMYPTDNGYKSSMLDKKKLSNLRYSYNSYYFDNKDIWYAYIENDPKKTGISGISIFDSNEVTNIRIPAPKNSNLDSINYYGNVDKIINPTGRYPIVIGARDADRRIPFTDEYKKLDYSWWTLGVDPVSMKYKSTPHAVMALNYTTDNYTRVLPTLTDKSYSGKPPIVNINTSINNVNKSWIMGDGPFWYPDASGGISQDALDIEIPTLVNGSGESRYPGIGPEFGWLWLGELYNDNVQNRFGGKTEEAFENNQWVPCGEPVSLLNQKGTIKDEITIEWVEGDTYYQRYDHLKTYPFTLEDQNAITDIVSFMCETRVNIDGRYDRNRGQNSNLAMNPTNFNLINSVYTQQNNFFNYRGVNSTKLNLNNFHNSITWTKTKQAGDLTDAWTNITLVSTLNLDGDKGNVRSLKRFNENLIVFQDTGISQILYNENVQIASTTGVPIEIANSNKVLGKRYLSDKIGCSNKWSICETPSGIYFIDNYSRGIYLFNGELNNLSDRLGFSSWMNTKSNTTAIWNPVNFNNFVTYYNKVNKEVLFISRDECLAFSELLSQFTSFYSYEHMPYFSSLGRRKISINTLNGGKKYKIWLQNEGDYNMFFNKYQPFYTTIIANPDMQSDKIFNNIEFRADSWAAPYDILLNTTFDTLTVWNEYQSGKSSLNNILGRPSPLKRKFRIWRANIPRNMVNGRDRMRNPWLYIKLSMNNENTNKTALHDIAVHYFE